jgi:hypothetical protein
MLIFLTILIMLGVAYAQLREGLLTGFTTLVNIFLAGIVAFNFWEPIADGVEPMLKGTFMEGCEDALCLAILFCLPLGLLRVATNTLANKEPAFPLALQRGGGAVCGLVSGYLVAGFLTCVLQTLPIHENFMGFDYKLEGGKSNVFRHLVPPDRVWLGLMQRTGSFPLSNEEDPKPDNPKAQEDRYLTFDKYSTFELRYGRYRRFNDDPKPPTVYVGEFDRELQLPRQ